MKTDKDGNEIWSKTYGTETNETGIAVQELEDDSLMIAGVTQVPEYQNGDEFRHYVNHVLLIKTDKDGNEIWSKSIPVLSWESRISSISFNSDGSLLLVASNKFLLKIDADGEKIWEKHASIPNLTYAESVRGTDETGFLVTGTEYLHGGISPDGTIHITAQTIKIDSKGDLEWSTIIEGVNGWAGKDAIFTKSGDVLMLANGYQASNSIMVQKLNSLGEVLWAKEHSLSDGNIKGQRLLESEGGDLYVVGEGFISTPKRKDAFILKLNSEGEKVETINYNFGIEDFGKQLIEGEDGDLLLVGNTRSFNGTGLDVLAMRLSKTGGIVWQKSFGEAGNMDVDIGTELLQLSDGGYLIGGHSSNMSEFGDSDISLIQLDENGEIQWTKTLDFFHGQDYCHRIVKVGEEGYAIWGESENEEGLLSLQLTRIDTEANVLWTKRFESLENRLDRRGISSIDSGGFAICGTFPNATESSYYAKLDEQGETIWEHNYDSRGLNSIKPTSDGGFILSGRGKRLVQNGGTMDGWTYTPVEILKVDSEGVPSWNYYWGEASFVNPFVASIDAIETISGDFAWLLNHHDPYPYVIAGMLDEKGSELWRNYQGGRGNSIAFSLAETSKENLLIMGTAWKELQGEGEGEGDGGAILTKLNCKGDRMWQSVFEGGPKSNFHFTDGMQIDDGSLVVIGNRTINNSSEIIFLKTDILNDEENPCEITSIEETPTLLSPLQLKPNLSRDFVELDFADSYTGEIEINVFDITGRLVVSFLENKNEIDYQKQLDIKNWSDGLYIVEVLSGNQSYTHKLIKQ